MKKGMLSVMLATFVAAGMAVGQDDSRRITTVEKQIQSLTKELELLKQQETDKKLEARIDELSKKVGEGGGKPEATAGFKKHFYVKSADDMFKLQFFGRVQTDFRFYEGGNVEPVWGGDPHDTIQIRRVRMGMDGHVFGKPHRFKAQIDFTHDEVHVRDGYMELAYVPWLKVRFGHFKTPFSREQLISSKYIWFVERNIATDNLSPERDYGVMAHGDLFDGHMQYATAIVQGADSDGGDDNDAFDWAYRVNVKPFKKSGNEWLEGLEFGHGLVTGNQPRGNSLRGRTAGDLDFFPRIQRHGTRTRVGVDGAWYKGSFGLQWELLHVDEHRPTIQWDGVGPPQKLGSIQHTGWYVQTAYLLTGEKKSAKHVKPKHNFDPIKGGWGAWEIACRIGQLEEQSNHPMFSRTYFDDWGNPYTEWYKHQQCTAFTMGVNWYLNPRVVFKVNWIHNMFDEALEGKSSDVDSVLGRFQIYW